MDQVSSSAGARGSTAKVAVARKLTSCGAKRRTGFASQIELSTCQSPKYTEPQAQGGLGEAARLFGDDDALPPMVRPPALDQVRQSFPLKHQARAVDAGEIEDRGHQVQQLDPLCYSLGRGEAGGINHHQRHAGADEIARRIVRPELVAEHAAFPEIFAMVRGHHHQRVLRRARVLPTSRRSARPRCRCARSRPRSRRRRLPAKDARPRRDRTPDCARHRSKRTPPGRRTRRGTAPADHRANADRSRADRGRSCGPDAVEEGVQRLARQDAFGFPPNVVWSNSRSKP